MDSVRLVNISASDTTSSNNNYYVDSSMIRVLPTHVLSSSICFGDSIKVGNHFHKTSGTFYDTLQLANGHDSLIITNLVVNALADTSVVLSGGQILVSQAIAPSSYQWINCTGKVAINNATGQSFTVTSSGSYAVILSQNNCRDTSRCHIIALTDIGTLTQGKQEINIYPNPNGGLFSIESNQMSQQIMKLYDANGKLVFCQSIHGKADIDVANLPDGIYTILLTGKEGIAYKRVIISK